VFKAVIFSLFLFRWCAPIFCGGCCVLSLLHGLLLGSVVMRVGFFILVSRCVVLIGDVHLCQSQYGFCMVMETSSFVFYCFFFFLCGCVTVLVGGAVRQHTYHALPMCERWPVWGEQRNKKVIVQKT
jgi:hypothetical protein